MILAAISQSRNDCGKILEEYQKKFGEQMIEINDYALYIQLQSKIARLLKEFRNYAIQQMSYNPENKYDPRNMIRKCPHC